MNSFQVKAALKRHGWFLVLVLAWLVLARHSPAPDPAAANRPALASLSETPASSPTPAAATRTAATLPAAVELPGVTPSSSPTSSPTSRSSPTSSPSPSPSATRTPSPTVQLTSTPSPPSTLEPAETPSPGPEDLPVSEATATATAPPASHPAHPQVPPLVLANYYPWYDPRTWSSGCTSGADQPQAGPYNSDDAAVIARHIGEAGSASLDGFVVHWSRSGDRTDTDLAQVLNSSPAGFNSTVHFLCHIVGCASQRDVIEQLTYLVTTYGAHSRFFRIDGKPVIMFSGMERVPRAGGGAVEAWARIRNAVDPNHTAWWIAEGLESAYLQVFDGLYIYKTDHACCPGAPAKAPTWAAWVRDWEKQSGQPKLWVGTVMPGWNDLNSTSAACNGPDSRVGVVSFARDRQDGAYYNQAWDYVLPTQPDFILVNSFNEWIEGSYIESSVQYGDLYLRLTAAGVARFKSSR